jgi:hypothetical protein
MGFAQGRTTFIVVLIVAGAVALVLLRTAFGPSEVETRAFLQRILQSDGRIWARGVDGGLEPFEAERLAAVEDARCGRDPDRNDSRGRYTVSVPSHHVCRYTLVTTDGARYATVLRANRVPAGGPAEAPVPGLSLVDPSRYRVGAFLLSPVGQREAEVLLPPSMTGSAP